jgi:hypothetical protein
MIDRYKYLFLVVILLFSFCVIPLHTGAKADPRIPRNKIVALVYDDSGSMWEQTGAGGDKLPIDNWKYANYALQSFAALMDTQDQLKVVFMSSPEVTESIELDGKLRQLEIDDIRGWEGKAGTPLSSVHTAIHELDQAAEVYDNSDFWLIVLTDGVFNQFDSSNPKLTKEQIEKDKRHLFTRLKDLKKKVEEKGAKLQTTLIPTETYLNPEEKLIMADIKRQWKESSNGIVLESKGQLDIIDRVNEVAALMTNRDPSQQDLFSLNPILEGDNIILQSPFPLRRITIMEQSAVENVSFQMKEFYINIKRIDHGMEGPYKIKTANDPAGLNPPIRGTFTHFKNVNGDSIIKEGTYRVVFDQPLTEEQKKNVQVLAEPAVDFKVDFQRINDDGSLTSDSSVFFEGSKIRLETTLIKSESSGEEIDIKDIDVENLFEVEAQVDEVNVPLEYDPKLNKFIGDFTMIQKENISVLVKVNIKGFYQKEKETVLHGYPIRKMELVAKTDSWSSPVGKLNEAEPFRITPMINGEEITEEELEEIFQHLKMETPGNRLKLDPKQEGNQILLYPKKTWPLFLTSVGEIPLSVSLGGKYPKEMAKESFTLNVQESIWQRFGLPILEILFLLAVLWYLFRIWKKPKFDYNRQSMEIKSGRRSERVRDYRGKTYNFRGALAQRWLNPFGPEKKSFIGLNFKADSKKDRVWLTKECQNPNLIVRHEKLEDRSNKEDILIFHNEEIHIERGNSRTVYIFKSH